MDLRINNKTISDWQKEEIDSLLQNPDSYRENEYIDYKKTFAFLEIPEKNKADEKRIEFCHDICSFANADSGYIFYGIEEEHGVPKKVYGVKIAKNNTDKFELDRRNELSKIQPVVPDVKFHFIKLEDEKFIVVMYIEKGVYVPYVYYNIDYPYYFYKRYGNCKKLIGYKEVEQMFRYKTTIAQAIKENIENRITAIRKDKEFSEKAFALLQIIPENFLSSNEIAKMYNKEKKENIRFQTLLNGFCHDFSKPFVDGLKFDNDGYTNGEKVRVYNNGIAELFIDLSKYAINNYSEGKRLSIWFLSHEFARFAEMYLKSFEYFTDSKRVFLCASIINAKGLITEYSEEYIYVGTVSEIENLCSPIEVTDLSNPISIKESLENLITVVCLACGVKHNIKKIIEDFSRCLF